MRDDKNGLIYEAFMFCFRVASKLLRQRPILHGGENLKDLPGPVIFTVTHDSYFEVPSLSRVYYSLKPKPGFLIMGKDDFLSGKYLSTNFGQKSRLVRSLLSLLDRTGIPEAFFRKMRVITIHRPFIESYSRKKKAIRQEIDEKIGQFRVGLKDGMSTLIFPEGTTWGYGGLKKLRSGIYQLVSGAYSNFRKKVYVLPINVKVDRCTKGKKDIFIQVGRPEFFMKSMETFNDHLEKILKRLHTITFSQIASLYVKRLAELYGAGQETIRLSREEIAGSLEMITDKMRAMVKRKNLPFLDEGLSDPRYFAKKIDSFIKFCQAGDYIKKAGDRDNGEVLVINGKRVLEQYTVRTFRKMNPLAFSANELLSLGEEKICHIFDRAILSTARA